MKRYIPALIIGAILISGPLATAQETKQPRGGKRGPAIEQRVNRLAQELNLKEEQKTKLKAAYEEQDKKLTELREDTNLSRQERQTKGRAMRDELEKKLKAILTPEQFQKMEKNRQEAMEKLRSGGERRGVKKN